MQLITSIVFALLCGSIISSTSAHMLMEQPVPYGKDTLDNSPLAGSNFPCKQRPGVYAISEVNTMSAGSSQSLSFKGTAVHGGGSCQVSLSKDREPTAQSKFKVIHSIIGACPGVDGGPSTFQFTIPDGVPNGDYALAWTWFNKIGNREMYMNCAPVTITGGSNDQSLYENLPDMFVANIPNTQCKIPEMKDIVFPNPGNSVETLATDALFTDLPPACGAQQGVSSTPPPPLASPQPTRISSSMSSQQSSAPATSVLTTIVTITKTPDITLTTDLESSTLTASVPLPTASNPEFESAQSSACEAGGSMICNGDDYFGLCNHGKIAWQPVASGTACKNGGIVKREVSAQRIRRHRRSFHH